ncbi:MAG: TolC family protein [Candidatus Omnitrophica bacterium]|nr:TolC family protein [Candidatus Omnitrophota bacterium]
MRIINRFILALVFSLAFISQGSSSDGLLEQKIYSLDDCIAKALKIHPKLSIYTYQTNQKKEKLRSVTADYFPRVDVVASYDRLSYVSQAKQRYLGGANDDYQADIVVTQPLFTGGKITSQKQSASYSLEAAKQGYLAAREDVIYGVKAAYYKLIFVRDIMRSKEDLLKYAESSYNTAVDLNKRTKLPREETLMRLEVQVNEVRQELITAQDGLTIAAKALLNAMGLNSIGTIEVGDLKDDYSTLDDIPVDLANNYQLLKLSNEVKEADEQIKAAKSGFYPQINARYSYGYEWGQMFELENKPEWLAGVVVDFNVWDWGKTNADVKQAKGYKNELSSYESLLSQEIGLDLESARLKYESAAKRFRIADTSFQRAKSSLDLFESRYRDALVTSIELLDAQKAFSQAQVNYALSMLDMRLAKAEIEKIAGRGYDLK